MYRDDILSYLSSIYAQIFRIYNSYIAHLCAPCINYIVSGDATHNCLPPPPLRNFLLVRLFTLPHAWRSCVILLPDGINPRILCMPLTITFYALLSQWTRCCWTLKREQWNHRPFTSPSQWTLHAHLVLNGSISLIPICAITTCRATTLRAFSPTPSVAPIKGAAKPLCL